MYIEKINTYIFVEQVKYQLNSISPKIKNIMREYDCLKIKGKEIWFKATGFLACDNILVIIFPKGYVVGDNVRLLNDARLLFAVLMKYQKDTILEPEEMRLLGGGNGSVNSSIFTAFKLIEDYKVNGLLKRNMKITTNQFTGNVNWASTINKKIPIFSNGYPIYHDAIYKKSKHDGNSMLISLHKYAISKSVTSFGWLFGLSEHDFSDYRTEIPCELTKAIHFLEIELRNTFIQREIDIIKWIMNILLEKDCQDTSVTVEMLLTKSFYYVWEAICSKILGNQYSTLKVLLPQPIWEIYNCSNPPAISHRPDILITRKNRFYILDAKYYDVNTSLPGWHDAVKQFFYGLSIRKSIEESNDLITNEELKKRVADVTIYENAFVLPSFNKEEVSKLGSITVPNICEYGKIDVFIIDARLAMKCYIGEKKYSFMNKIESLIG
ncbi:LlaJI family restriction endonuclease [Tissierella praeacuta]|uniref:LlaJI family restriction endonuclease n=1 Tax=Tissierella praeacuta TaxID=43131 RepID=UPI00333F92FA